MDLDDLLRLREEYERALDTAEDRRATFHRAIRRLYMSGTPLQVIADYLGVSRQRVHQIVGVEPQRTRRRRGRAGAMVIAVLAVALVGSVRAGASIAPLRLSFFNEGVTAVTMQGQRILLLREGGEVRGFLGAVPHLGESLTWCPVERVFLSFAHGELFDSQGRYVSGPATRDLDLVNIEVRGDLISVGRPRVFRSIGRSAGSVSGMVLAAYRDWYEGEGAGTGFCEGGFE